MRIYELAKSLGQTFNREVKSTELAEEFKTLPQFADIHDSIKSHASSVDDKHARLMFDIYRARHGNPENPSPLTDKIDTAPMTKTATPPKPAMPAKSQGGDKAAVPPRPAPPRPAVPARPAPRPQAGPPRPQPIRPQAGGPPRAQPIPAARRPKPIEPTKAAPEPTPPKPAQPAPEATAQPKAPQPAPQAKAEKPGASQGVRAVSPKATKPRPSALATELKSSSGTTGISASPGQNRGEGKEAREGQPKAPAMPKFSTDSPFVKRPPEAKKEAPAADKGRKETAKTDESAAPADPNAALQVPEIGVMKLTGPGGGKGKRGRDKEREADDKKPKKKGMRPSKVYGCADEFRRPLKPATRKKPTKERRQQEQQTEVRPQGPVILTGPLTVAEFSEKVGKPASDIIKQAFMKGQAITINQLIDLELAEEMAIELDVDLRIELEGDETDVAQYRQFKEDEETLAARPPVVTIMGHVDHGKTSVLDYYRKSQVTEGEFGGITQHIGAYQVTTGQGSITFLDTPGHEAFTSMRARGAQCTDIVVLIVGADDGVMPQTVEAIHHAQAAKVPIIVAINKVDLPQADPQRVRNELMQHSLVPTNLGGDVEVVEISAKQGKGMDDLLEIITLQSQVLELKANPDRRAEGVIIESHVDPLRGSVATLLVQQGTLHIGDVFVVGQESGRVRAMLDDHGRPVEDAGPAIPVELIGLTGTPEVGELMLVMEDERKAREIAERREYRRRLMDLGTTRHISLEGLSGRIAEGDIKELNIILKADVQGSVEAIIQSLEKLGNDEIRVRVLHSGTGSITESDVSLALASSAIIIGFNVRPESHANDLAQQEQVEIRSYRIIYELLEDIEKALVGMLDKQYKEQDLGKAQVRQIFRITKVGVVAGCMVLSGEIQRSAQARLVRDGTVVWEGRISGLRRVKDDVAKVAQGFECGISLERFQDVKEGDIIECFVMEELPAVLTRSEG